MTKEQAAELAEKCGFSHWGFFQASDLRFLQEVRDMCAADKCHKYDNCWSCPPACGTLEESRAKASGYDWGILLQSTGAMEDDFDVETMMGTEEEQKSRLAAFVEALDAEERYLPMSSGACCICKTCTYPDAPCRFPDRMITSMEAYGLVVSEVCESADTPYYYGPGTITYTSCVLF
ncbi:MAG: DUF2284 domain-containing protein [Lachnospiraceae bacterium]|jgi:predicted metal-binding protein|uniref:DUF2284 domain-containing protein n=1 Tax=Clostridium sp. (strain SY8519) TaxID=1042156 RepID=UPI0002171E12|nr:DUF2284 domain-containing protein [Clostridium sp. SY8519]MCI1653942.1 DUF2284 domain-containing protein [Lachnospiraceae bacterium]MCI1656149.1 DUF2284 domain-containing protein [Lachnospiraceae bacterium]MCI2194631.1 DUF2284 domain-containing protein [Lachnospiraceae bacterium]BAK47196.1 hypothetical protein CXIVA_12300 [Clostridium sp. SY8519]